MFFANAWVGILRVFRNRQKPGSSVRGRKSVFAILALLFGVLLFVRTRDQSTERYVVLDLAEHPPGTATPYVPKRSHFPAFYLVHTTAGEVYAVVRLDPNSRCLVVWDETEQNFLDPCDGAGYNESGFALAAGAENLDRLYLERTDANRVFIDMGVRYSTQE